MASDKRNRQRENRGIKQGEESKVATRNKRRSIVKRYLVYTLIFSAAIIALKLFSG